MKFFDGLVSLYSSIANVRSVGNQNAFINQRKLSDDEARAISKTGIGRRILTIKSEWTLSNTIEFDSEGDENFYKESLKKSVEQAVEHMITYGRGVVVMFRKGDLLSDPLIDSANSSVMIYKAFGGDLISVVAHSIDLTNDRYMKPIFYSINGQQIHHSRVIDFCYKMPSDRELSLYQFGGISEFEFVRDCIVWDAAFCRAVAAITEKSSNYIYKIEGLKDNVESENENFVVKYISAVESARSVYGATIIDKEDDVQVLVQGVDKVAETDQIILRRVALSTGIPVSVLVGESVRGLNSTGETEYALLANLINGIQEKYILDPLNELMKKSGCKQIKFKTDKGKDAAQKVELESKIIANAASLQEMGEDHGLYLEKNNIVKPTNFDKFFGE